MNTNINTIDTTNTNAISSEQFDSVQATELSTVMADKLETCDIFKSPELNALATHLRQMSNGMETNKFSMSKMVADSLAYDKSIYENDGFTNAYAFYADTFGMKKQSVINLAQVGKRPDVMKLRHLGFNFSACQILARLKQDELREAVVTGSIAPGMANTAMRDYINTLRGKAPKELPKADEPEQERTPNLIADEIRQRLAELKLLGVDTSAVEQALNGAMLDYADKQE